MHKIISVEYWVGKHYVWWRAPKDRLDPCSFLVGGAFEVQIKIMYRVGACNCIHLRLYKFRRHWSLFNRMIATMPSTIGAWWWLQQTKFIRIWLMLVTVAAAGPSRQLMLATTIAGTCQTSSGCIIATHVMSRCGPALRCRRCRCIWSYQIAIVVEWI